MAHQAFQSKKMGPRKFSEKIALLNKKQAEGTAKFEEIIKEVQATKSNGARPKKPHPRSLLSSGNRASFDDQVEIEDVYEELVNCVSQLEQEQELLLASGEPGASHQLLQQPEERVLRSQQQFCNSYNSEGFLAGQAYQNFENNEAGSGRADSNYNHVAYYSPANSFRPEMEARGYRSRVTSFGSANSRQYVAAQTKVIGSSSSQQPLFSSRYNPYPSDSPRSHSRSNMYLAPSEKASWQKSSSDPTLNVLSAAPSSQETQAAAGAPEEATSLEGQRQAQGFLGSGACEVPNIQICINLDETLSTSNSCDATTIVPQLSRLQFSPEHQPLPASEQDAAACNQFQPSELNPQQACCSQPQLPLAPGSLQTNPNNIGYASNVRVSNPFSISERSLDATNNLPSSACAGNIMRSYSHNCIDRVNVREQQRAGQQPCAALSTNSASNNQEAYEQIEAHQQALGSSQFPAARLSSNLGYAMAPECASCLAPPETAGHFSENLRRTLHQRIGDLNVDESSNSSSSSGSRPEQSASSLEKSSRNGLLLSGGLGGQEALGAQPAFGQNSKLNTYASGYFDAPEQL